jgi:hypothetical protein
MQKYCEACGMPMNKKEDFALENENSKFCLYCVNPDGSMKSCEEIFEAGVQFFISILGGGRKLAEKATRKNMNMQSYWQDKEYSILKGEIATDEEFSEILKKLTK